MNDTESEAAERIAQEVWDVITEIVQPYGCEYQRVGALHVFTVRAGDETLGIVKVDAKSVRFRPPADNWRDSLGRRISDGLASLFYHYHREIKGEAVDVIAGARMTLAAFERFITEGRGLDVTSLGRGKWDVSLILGAQREFPIPAGIVTALEVGDRLTVEVYANEWDVPREAEQHTDDDGNVWEIVGMGNEHPGRFAELLAQRLRRGLQEIGALEVERGRLSDTLTTAEPGGPHRQVLELWNTGHKTAEIAAIAGYSPGRVLNIISELRRTLGPDRVPYRIRVSRKS